MAILIFLNRADNHAESENKQLSSANCRERLQDGMSLSLERSVTVTAATHVRPSAYLTHAYCILCAPPLFKNLI